MVRSPVVSIMMLEIGVTRPGIRTMALPSMPSRSRSSKICSAPFSPAWAIGPDIRTRPPSRAMAMAAFSALPPLYSVKCVARILLPRAGIFSTRNTRSRTGMPTQRMFGGRCCAVMGSLKSARRDRENRRTGRVVPLAGGCPACHRGLGDPDFLAQRLREPCGFRGVIRRWRHQSPHRARPRGVTDTAGDEVDMQLRHDIAEGGDIHLVGLGVVLQRL